ncbi:DUF4905 domain-containing protein [Desertivirga xinjiangensis]|uniref:DUF4905 domain-containing protein n=1 Tax=Desertivirga xinjiangensis TaxID=539206 RepID=UPI002109CE63|nr:DUF4905 domain-containing protein [Pedobacter xinjiangensis]
MHSDDKYTLKPFLKEKFRGIIWKVVLDEQEPVIAVETRDPENHISEYSAYNFETGTCLFKEQSVEDSWLWSLDKAHEGLIFLHSYISEQSPEHKGIIALNRNGALEWQQYNKTLQAVSVDGLVTYDPRIQPRRLELLKPENGMPIANNIQHYTSYEQDIRLPDIINNSKELPSFFPANVEGPVWVLSIDDKNCYAYHIKKGGNLTQQLIISQGNNILIQDNLEENIQKLNPEAFFISRHNLFCIRGEKREIVSYLV